MKKYIKLMLGIGVGVAAMHWHGSLNGQMPSMPQQQQQQAANPAEARNMQLSAEAADRWLKLMDEGRYGESWDASSNITRFTIKRDEWIKAQEGLRKPLGNVVSRNLVLQSPAKDPKGLPEGDYMVLYFKTQFANRPSANELVTMVLSTDGQWKVLTYQGNISGQ